MRITTQMYQSWVGDQPTKKEKPDVHGFLCHLVEIGELSAAEVHDIDSFLYYGELMEEIKHVWWEGDPAAGITQSTAAKNNMGPVLDICPLNQEPEHKIQLRNYGTFWFRPTDNAGYEPSV